MILGGQKSAAFVQLVHIKAFVQQQPLLLFQEMIFLQQ